jgi:hypothetical protein
LFQAGDHELELAAAGTRLAVGVPAVELRRAKGWQQSS